MHRRGLEAELARRLQPCVPGQHDHRLVHDDGLTPAELLDRGRDRGDGLLVAPGIARIRDDLLKRQVDDVHGNVLGVPGGEMGA